MTREQEDANRIMDYYRYLNFVYLKDHSINNYDYLQNILNRLFQDKSNNIKKLINEYGYVDKSRALVKYIFNSGSL